MPGQGKKRKGYYIKSAKGKSARQSNDLGTGCKGFLITCNNGERNSREATLEAYRVLNEYADLKYGPETKENEEEDDENGEVNLEDALQKEVSDIKESNSKGAARRFQRLKCKVKSCIFIQTELSDPNELSDSIYEDLIATQVRKTKICLKFIPVVRTCYASTEKIVEAAKEICKPIFVEQAEEKLIRFCFLWQVTANSSLNRDDVVLDLCKYVCSKQEHITEYTDPEIAVNIRIIGNTCCISVLKNFVRFCKYNIDSVVKPVKEEDGEVKAEPTEDKDKVEETAELTDLWDYGLVESTEAGEGKEKEDKRTVEPATNAVNDELKSSADEAEKCEGEAEDTRL